MKRLGAFAVCLLGLVLGLSGCNPVKAKGIAEKSVKEFHDQLNKGEFKAIYSGAHADLKAASTEKDFVALLTAIHKKLGLVQSSEADGWNINSHNLQTNVNLSYKTKFAEGQGVETFTYRIDDEKAALVGYHINSNDLITK